MRVYPLGWR